MIPAEKTAAIQAEVWSGPKQTGQILGKIRLISEMTEEGEVARLKWRIKKRNSRAQKTRSEKETSSTARNIIEVKVKPEINDVEDFPQTNAVQNYDNVHVVPFPGTLRKVKNSDGFLSSFSSNMYLLDKLLLNFVFVQIILVQSRLGRWKERKNKRLKDGYVVNIF